MLLQEKSKKNKFPARKKIALELLHQRLGHRSTRSLLSGDTDNVWEDVELRIDPDPFCTSCQISPMNKKARSKIPLKPKAPFKWIFMDIIPSTAPKSLTSDTSLSNSPFNCWCLVQNSKTLWYGENHNRKSYGKIGYVSVQIRENWPIWMVGFIMNFIRCRYAVYLDGVQRWMPNSRS